MLISLFMLLAMVVTSALAPAAHAGLLGEIRQRDLPRHPPQLDPPVRNDAFHLSGGPLPLGLPYSSGEPIGITTKASDVAVADLDGDGRDDLAVAERHRVSVWSTAARVFLFERSLEDAKHLAVGDLVGDSIPDLAVLTEGWLGAALHVWRGVGGGQFVPHDTILVGRMTTGLVAADFDADGRTDLALSSSGDSTVYALRGTPEGPGAPEVVARDPGPAALSSFEHAPGGEDLVVAYDASWKVCRFRRMATGLWTTIWTIQSLSPASEALLRDLDADGHPELAIVHPEPMLEVLRGDPLGGFSYRDTVTLRGRLAQLDLDPPRLAATDLDGNGTVELFVGVRGGWNQAWVHGIEILPTDVRVRASYFVGAGGLGDGLGSVTALCIADLDDDGGRDLVIGSQHDGRSVVLLRMMRGFAYAGMQEYPIPFEVSNVTAADAIRVDGSPRDALLLSRGNRSHVISYSAYGLPEAITEVRGGLHDGVLDLDHDDWLDLVRVVGDTLRITRGGPEGPGPTTTEYAEGAFIAFGDFDGDGDPDVVTRGVSGELRLLANDGTGQFATTPLSQTVPAAIEDADSGDLDGDGRDDLVLRSPLTHWGASHDGLACLRSTGAGFELMALPPLVKPEGYYAPTRQVVCRDLDGDGRDDILTLNGNWYDASNWIIQTMNRGDGAFEQGSTLVVRPEGAWLFTGDIDDDGDVDCASPTFNWAGGRLQMWLNDGAGGLQEHGFSSEGIEGHLGLNNYPGRLALGHFDDGPTPDLAFAYWGSELNEGAGFGLLLNTNVDGATGVHATLLSIQSSPERVGLEWLVSGGVGRPLDVWRERNSRLELLGPAAFVAGDRVAFEDRTVHPGMSASYRLRHAGLGEWLGEWVLVSVPSMSPQFGLSTQTPNPVIGAPIVRFEIQAGSDATLSLYDVTGRRVRHIVLPAGPGGAGVVHLHEGGQLEPGLYWIRLQQGTQLATARFVVIR